MLLQNNALIRIDGSSFNSYILTPKYIHFLKRWNPKTTLTICQAKREGDGEKTYGCPNIYIYINSTLYTNSQTNRLLHFGINSILP